ncbi:hypothetical protein DQ237_19150 [Blastococcus sp. TF02-8]|uniref:hypothetical protein n=1 Tax=Blastococcus sp. TF02-8 TaxID=2250574 RepID=UPI000DE9425A|nr:hypothetical protein [Blastococcus sp. TF02-8]RBY91931.1 hypothetical protein DQ237_19150 [Blastococcus sp. TF02-8]
MPDHDRTRSDLDATASTEGAHATRGAARDAVDAQHDRYGGIKWGAAFFGWLSANGLAVILLAILSAAGVAFGLTQISSADQAAQQATDQADTIGIAGGIALTVVLFLAYLAGGYVAGRMARFDGLKQGLAVWLIGLLIVAALAIAGAVLGSEYNVLSQLNMPTVPVSGDTLTTAGIIAGIVALLITLLGAVLGGKLGERYHRKVDRAGAGT